MATVYDPCIFLFSCVSLTLSGIQVCVCIMMDCDVNDDLLGPQGDKWD